MNHGALGYIEGYELFLPEDLLRPLSIIHHTELFGIYYPKPRAADPGYVDHDLMITPVPYRLWPKIGHYVIRLHHRPRSILEVSRALAKSKVSILLAEVTRDGHRYDTWNLTVSFDFLPDPSELTFDDEESRYVETSQAVANMREAIIEECSGALFSDKRNADLRESVVAIEQTALAYFYFFSRKQETRSDAHIYKPFTLRYDASRNSLIDYGDKEFKNVLDHIWSGVDPAERRAIVPASVDSGDLNIRAVVVPTHQGGRFFEGRIEYNKTGNPGSRGLLAHFLGKMGYKQNIWRLFNHTKLHRDRREEGSVSIIFEDLVDKVSDKQRLDFARDSFEKMRYEALPDELAGVDTVRAEVYPLTPARVRARLGIARERRRIFRYDVFISFAATDAQYVNKLAETFEDVGVRFYRFEKKVEAGRKFREEIRLALRSSMDFCLVCSAASLQSEWVHLEWGAAWGMGMNIVPVLTTMEIKDLPQALRELQCISLLNEGDVRRFAENLAERADSVSEGFFETLRPDFYKP